ncbi:MAG TPA: DUF3108 domain-containing protein [Burkholderiaceae bacterium]|jgi:hypothetical protein|nr:DUF3108 domain-containing protein [Burkholderiaceae bacterium]
MMRLRLAFALLAGCLAPAAAPAQTVAPACVRGAPPPDFTLDFAVTAARPPLRLNGSNRLDYSAADGRYTLRSVLDAGGLYSARQESSGNVDSAGWRPQRYEETTTRRGTSSASIDWTAQRVTFSGDEAPADAPAGLQDRLSILLHLGREQARRPKTSGYDLPIVGPRHVSRYRIEVQGRERIDVPYGRFETVRLVRLRDDGDDRLEVWLAPALCWLPVQLRFVEARQTIEQRLSAARFAPPR